MLVVDRQQTAKLSMWISLRHKLESSFSPLDDVSKYFEKFPLVKFYTDPYDQETWPTAWELIDENEYCRFNVLLGICYTLQLTERFKDCQPIIKIAIDIKSKNLYYLLLIDNAVYGLQDRQWVELNQLPKTLKIQKIYAMKPIH